MHSHIVSAVEKLEAAGYTIPLRNMLHITKHFAVAAGTKARTFKVKSVDFRTLFSIGYYWEDFGLSFRARSFVWPPTAKP